MEDKPAKEPPLITLFTSWVTFPERYLVFNNTLRNWASLGSGVRPILFTNDSMDGKVQTQGWQTVPLTKHVRGYAILKYMFLEAMKLQPNSKLYGFSNGDILYTDSLVKTLHEIVNSPLVKNKTFLIVGSRMSTPNVSRDDANTWTSITEAAQRGTMMGAMHGIDYFITSPNHHWSDIPGILIGNLDYDNWMVYDARRMGYTVIDATNTLLAVHQNAPYPKTVRPQGRTYNLGVMGTSRNVLWNKGTLPCSDLRTVYGDYKVKLKRHTDIPSRCKL